MFGHSRFQSISLVALSLYTVYDALEGTWLRSAFGDFSPIALCLWTGGSLMILNLIAISAMLSPFYSAGGKVWTRGGREQFGYAGGFTVSTFGPIGAFIIVISSYPYLASKGLIIICRPVTIALIAGLLTSTVCWLGAILIFKRQRFRK